MGIGNNVGIQQPIALQIQPSSASQRSSFINNAQIQLQAPSALHPSAAAAMFATPSNSNSSHHFAGHHHQPHHALHSHHAIGIHPMLQAQTGSPFIAINNQQQQQSSSSSSNSNSPPSTTSSSNPSEFQPRASSAAPPFPRTSIPTGPTTAFHQISSPICQPSTGGIPVVPLLTSSQSFNSGGGGGVTSSSSGGNKVIEGNRASFLAPRPVSQAVSALAASDRKPEELDAVANELLSEFVLKKADNNSKTKILTMFKI